MRDGTELATDVYLPAGPGPHPTLLERTPYGKSASNRADRTAADATPRSRPDVARQFAAAGYAYVLQDCRGRFESGGTFTKYLNEGPDGEDALAWVLAQPWCNGRVGTLGLSYGAHVQAALACGNPPGLGAMFLDSGGFSSAYHGGIRQGGAFELKQLTWSYKHALLSPATARDPARRRALEAQDLRSWMGRRWAPGHSPLAAAPEYEGYVLEQWGNDSFSTYWQQRGIYAQGWYEHFANVPQVHMSSWYDPYSQTAIDNYCGLARRITSPVRLILGPWTHGQRSVTHAGAVDFGPAATLDGNLAEDYFALRRAWFDQHLRAAPGPGPLPDPVMIFVMGGGSGRRNASGRLEHGGRWRAEADWPLPRTRTELAYLQADGGLAAAPPADPETRTITADPHHPVPTVGGAITSAEPIMFGGAYDQREGEAMLASTHPGRALADHPGVAVFRGPVLDEDTELTGNVVARLHISIDTPDADIAIKLIDEYPPSADYPEGFAMNLAHGILRLRFRDGFEQPCRAKPGQVYEVTVACFPTSNLFRAGHRIRIDLAGSNFPHFDVNPNTDWAKADQPPQVARITVHCGPEYPSRLELPVIPPQRG